MEALQVRQGSLGVIDSTMHCLFLMEGVIGPGRVSNGQAGGQETHVGGGGR